MAFFNLSHSAIVQSIIRPPLLNITYSYSYQIQNEIQKKYPMIKDPITVPIYTSRRDLVGKVYMCDMKFIK